MLPTILLTEWQCTGDIKDQFTEPDMLRIFVIALMPILVDSIRWEGKSHLQWRNRVLHDMFSSKATDKDALEFYGWLEREYADCF